jgi:hypothetical protein
LKQLPKLDGEQSSDGDPFYYCESDSLRDPTANLSVCSIAETGVCLIDTTEPGKAGQEDSLAAGHGRARGNRRELGWAVTAISETKARDLAWVDFSEKPCVQNPRDFAGDWIDQLSLVGDQLAAVKLRGWKREELLRLCTESAALKT